MDSLAGGALIVLALIAFNNYKNGTLPMWLRAKFFNQDPGGPIQLPTRTGGGGAGTPLATIPQAYTGGAMLTPVNGPITGRFGEQRPGHRHEGIDYAVAQGTPVAAARAGKVIAAGAAGGYGLKVDVDHGNNVRTRYAHLSKINVRVGDTVAAGTTVGLSGNTGESTGPHLHFEVLVNGVAKDPTSYVGALAGQQAVSA